MKSNLIVTHGIMISCQLGIHISTSGYTCIKITIQQVEHNFGGRINSWKVGI
ncbi:unnamed protein product [Schistosoma curassoni]|uniref:Uncharacterized protein n=1 Tax=Schistosoma curassoni TaxID=6186 RepID=A0A183KZ56_9TREM|nr:unnamed protein product [Schistosoma curassoni]